LRESVKELSYWKMLNLNRLNDTQREAVIHGDGALLVLAGPGSGKTTVIVQRLFFLMEQKQVPPEKLLVITFTKEAALSMQQRFSNLSHQTLPVNFGTFHSVFYHIIQKSHNIKQNHILTDAEKKKLIVPIIKKYIAKGELAYRQELREDAIQLLSAISYLKNTGDEKATISLLSQEWRGSFLHIMEEYETKKKEICAMDFDDMVYECYRLLKRDRKAREYWQQRFDHILIDEFQDINPMQYQVVRLLTTGKSNLFVVGDDDQSIYGFRGSRPEILKQFWQEYNAKKICLDTNYRSSKEIIKASLSVINENQNRFHKTLKASPEQEIQGDNSPSVTIRPFPEREQEYEYLVSKLRDDNSKHTTAVLFRTNAYMQGVAARLSREGIPYTMKEKVRSIYEHFIVKDIMAYLCVASGIGNRAMFLQIMNKPSRQINREAVGEGKFDYRIVKSFYQKQGLNAPRIRVIQAIEQMDKQMQCLKRLSPFPAVQYIRKAVGYEGYLKGKAQTAVQWKEWEEMLEWLSTDALNYSTVKDWLEAQEQYTRKLKQRGPDVLPSTGIFLMTVHASKGLEFDSVLIPDCNEKIFPHGSMPDEDSLEEERRIFYVAMTRAKKNLELLYLTGTKERPRLSSRFLNPLLKTYSSTNSSNSQLSKYSSKASATRSYSSSSSM